MVSHLDFVLEPGDGRLSLTLSQVLSGCMISDLHLGFQEHLIMAKAIHFVSAILFPSGVIHKMAMVFDQKPLQVLPLTGKNREVLHALRQATGSVVFTQKAHIRSHGLQTMAGINIR